MNATYAKYEFLRLFRNKRFFIFSIGIPLALFLTIGGANKDQTLDQGAFNISFLLYYMVGMAGYGATIAALAGGARIAAERSVGWNRQLRLTPLTPRNYFQVKVLTGYFMAMLSIALVYAAGVALGVRIHPIGDWFQMTGLMLVALIPFLAMGIVFGHLLTVDSIGPALGGSSALFGFLGGQWTPLPATGALHFIAECIPSYWMTQASHVGIGGAGWPAKGWLVVGIWAVAMTVVAVQVYRRDTRRV
ncbi:ABC-2 type transport system permease protein [Frankineae bacterium MT45]|nr:ABC-2 type transport system permease protein [Frankineae bacterium MT45]